MKMEVLQLKLLESFRKSISRLQPRLCRSSTSLSLWWYWREGNVGRCIRVITSKFVGLIVVFMTVRTFSLQQMLVEMKEEYGLELNRYCYSAVVKALANGGQWKRALEKLDEMRENGLSADPVVYTAAIGACEKVRKLRPGRGTIGRSGHAILRHRSFLFVFVFCGFSAGCCWNVSYR